MDELKQGNLLHHQHRVCRQTSRNTRRNKRDPIVIGPEPEWIQPGRYTGQRVTFELSKPTAHTPPPSVFTAETNTPQIKDDDRGRYLEER